jgi:hypothetical protein
MTNEKSSILTRFDLWLSKTLFGRYEVPDLRYTSRSGSTRSGNIIEWIVWEVIGWLLFVGIIGWVIQFLLWLF